jgi:hypothetical protein
LLTHPAHAAIIRFDYLDMKEKLTVCGLTRKNNASADQRGKWIWACAPEEAAKIRRQTESSASGCMLGGASRR